VLQGAARCCKVLQGAAWMLLSEWCACFGAGMLVPLQGAAAEYRYRVLQGAAWMLLSEWCACFGAGMLVALLLPGAAAGCCLRVLLSEWRVRFGAPLQAGCCLRVCCCQNDVCALEHAWFLVPLQGAAVRESCLCFGACLLVPLEGAAAGCC